MSTEKNEKEIRQVNFRIDQASADAFRSFCTANGMNQAQGFDHLIQVLELNNAKAAVAPGKNTLKLRQLGIMPVIADTLMIKLFPDFAI